MRKSTYRRNTHAGESSETRKNKNFTGLLIGGSAMLLLVLITTFACSKSASVKKLVVEDMVVGTGREAKTGDTLVVEYIGWIYGADRSSPFDQSAHHDAPYSFVLGKGQAIEGFEQGLAGMKVGGQRKLTVPANLAYGAKGALDGKIPPDTALVFEVELLDVLTKLAELPPTSVKALKVEDRTIGTGAEARPGKILTVHYTGWLEDGTQFDSSHDKEEPIEFILGKGYVIAGWEQGLLGMKVGGIRKLTIPPHLGYGEKGSSNYVPPNAALIFEVELLAVRDKP